MNIRTLTMAALLIAIGVVTAHTIVIPAGVAKAFPMQHAINVVAAMLLGTPMAVVVAFVISLLRNLLGTGSLLAFPGSIFGALLAGFIFQKTGRPSLTMMGEILGTSLLGALVAFPLATYVMGFEGAWLFFILPFGISSASGAVIGVLVMGALCKSKAINLRKGGCLK
ncbi:energy coupling factor transporter S component ThiW [Tindallia magadiensis]|uniref:Energy coupling factor transporter S component ThiW n=1 Tax=Tindallia magadiensis TaxID=69895 RepID=A0A1I3CT61_9FIRM|nr:energy coupling factor transporter S component ThiW [Tindallia magadiensis]SFH77526.1 energy coupling factor transporter S component ThiW [Tindallia magadiensis]